MRVLSVASECFPYIKTGGLADVAGALPAALELVGVEMRTLLPAYPAVLERIATEPREIARSDDVFGGSARLLMHESLLLLDAPHLFQRPGNPYLGPDGRDWPDNDLRFAALCWIAHAIGSGHFDKALQGWKADVLHGHDWQAGLLPAYLRHAPHPHDPGAARRPPTVLTIHNLAFQGLFDRRRLADLGLPAECFAAEGLEFHGRIGFLKAGLYYSDAITTVSPTYAREIQTSEHGMGLDGLLRARSGDLVGIINGIDETVWNPADDATLPAPCNKAAGKAACKKALQERLGLAISRDAPLFCVISRLTRQKGLDLLLEELDFVLEAGGQLALLGSGDADLEAGFLAAARNHPDQIGCVIGYDEQLAHLIQAGGDAIVIPSRFEPCGLTQLCGQRYGNLPIVARVGGLADTVIDANPAALQQGVATGFQFLPVDRAGLRAAMGHFLEVFNDKKCLATMRRQAMARRVGWSEAAMRYASLYERVLENSKRPAT